MAWLIKKQRFSGSITFERDDKLNRKFIAENFNMLFGNTSQSFVVALDSPWGSGKTQFMHMWKNLLEESGKKSIYFNIWEEDFLRNPFFSLTEMLYSSFEEENIGDNKTRKDLKKIGWELAKAAVNKVLNVDMNNLIDEDYNKKQKRNKEEFKKKLFELAKRVKEKTEFPLIIFIDELDRCRPDYAIEFLEIIKHFFDVENIIFVFGMDIEQLQHSVKSLYGFDMNAKEYLKKFIDIDYSFPKTSLDNYLDFLFSEFNCGKKDSYQITVVKEIIKKFGPPLRAIDNLFTRLSLIEGDINLNYIQASFLLSLKTFERERYNQLIKREFDLPGITNLKKYFDIRNDNFGKIIFWNLANDFILERSNTEIEYLHNLQTFFLDLISIWKHIEGVLSGYLSSSRGFQESNYCYNELLKIFLEDKNISKQLNIDIVKSIFRGKDYNLKELRELLQKIDFLEGLNFSKEKVNEK